MTLATLSTCVRGIVCHADEVRRIRSGTQTRIVRPMRPQPTDQRSDAKADLYNHEPNRWAFWLPDLRMTEPRVWTPPILDGKRHFVKETWAKVFIDEPPHSEDSPFDYEYRADTGNRYPGYWPDDCSDDPDCGRWRSATTMPCSAARIEIDVTNVRPVRLGEVTEVMARECGFVADDFSKVGVPCFSARQRFDDAWNTRYPKAPWAPELWVWTAAIKLVTDEGGNPTGSSSCA